MKYPPTYRIEASRKSITCLGCGRTSFNANDVAQRYCGFCHVFHDDIYPPAREWWAEKQAARFAAARGDGQRSAPTLPVN